MAANTNRWAVYGIFFTTIGVAATLVLQGGNWLGFLTDAVSGSYAFILGLLFLVVAGGSGIAYLVITRRANDGNNADTATNPTPATANDEQTPATPTVPSNITITTHADRTVSITISLP